MGDGKMQFFIGKIGFSLGRYPDLRQSGAGFFPVKPGKQLPPGLMAGQSI
jgi:hypothetical protein